MTQISFEAYGKTDVGRVRPTNQDSLLIDRNLRLFIVADGMGGHAGGEVASKLCVNEIAALISERLNQIRQNSPKTLDAGATKLVHPDARIRALLVDAVNHASTRIYEKALEEPSLRGMGTTATVALLVDDNVYFAHVGDSRLYLIRCGLIFQLTHDHSLVSEQLRAGTISEEEAQSHHLRNVITRSVGYQEEEDVDTFHLVLEDGDVILLCSDGLHGKVSQAELYSLGSAASEQAASELINLANSRGGDDNITLILLKAKVFH